MNTGNLMLVGETGSGKTNFIQTMLFDLVANNSPEELNFYILDFSSRNLSIYREVPHCGEVLTDESEEKIVQVFDIIENIIRDRRDKFAKVNVSTIQAYRKIEKIPVVLLVIDNILGFDEFRDKSEYISKISDFMSNGVSYGVRVILRSTRLTIVRQSRDDYPIQNTCCERETVMYILIFWTAVAVMSRRIF